MKVNLVDAQIVREISLKKKKLESLGPLSALRIDKPTRKALETEALHHSHRVEYPIREAGRTHFDTHASKRKLKKTMAYLQDVFHIAKDSFSREGFTPQLLIDIVSGIEDGRNRSFRTCPVRIVGATWSPPNYLKVPGEVNRLCENVSGYLDNSTNISDILNASIYAHLHTVRIHPFGDGNGRTARILQNVILQSNGLPPPVIYEGERFDYFEHLDRAIRDYIEEVSTDRCTDIKEGEKSFGDYIAGKVSASLDRLLD